MFRLLNAVLYFTIDYAVITYKTSVRLKNKQIDSRIRNKLIIE